MSISALKRLCWLGAPVLLLAAGCAEQSTSPLLPEDEAVPVPPSSVMLLNCEVDVASGSVSCEPASGVPNSASSLNLVVGSQHQFVRMANSAPSVAADVWSMNVTVQNLTLQPMGTPDGTAVSATGVRVFFVQEPTNDVVINNHDGAAAFTGSTPQKFYEYSGALLGADQILSQGEVSGAKSWQFQLNGATTFRFSVLISTTVPDATAFSVRLTRVAAGALHSCGEGSDGKLYCWGRNSEGQLGDGTTTQRNTPVAVSAPAGVTLSGVTAGNFHTCAEGSNGQAYCWGINSSGRLGDGTTIPRQTPVAVSAPTGVTLSGVTAGGFHTCAEGSNRQAYCWGSNNNGQLGDGTSGTNRLTPTAVSAPTGVTLSGLTAGREHTCAQGSNGQAYCWGSNNNGQLGDGTSGTNRLTPVAVGAPTGLTLSGVTAGTSHACAQGPNGQVYCWGGNDAGQLGDGTTEQRLTPTAVSAPAEVTLSGLTAGGLHTCAQGSDGKLYCWGWNRFGQLGDGSIETRLTPVVVSAPAGVTLSGVTAGGEHTCAQGSNAGGSSRPAYCWGLNGGGRLGDGTTTQRLTPVIVASTR